MSRANELMEIVNEFKAELEAALWMFGTYTFDSKGASEVLDIDLMTYRLRELSPRDAAAVLHEMWHSEALAGRLSQLSHDLACDLQDWDELFEQELMEEFEL